MMVHRRLSALNLLADSEKINKRDYPIVTPAEFVSRFD